MVLPRIASLLLAASLVGAADVDLKQAIETTQGDYLSIPVGNERLVFERAQLADGRIPATLETITSANEVDHVSLSPDGERMMMIKPKSLGYGDAILIDTNTAAVLVKFHQSVERTLNWHSFGAPSYSAWVNNDLLLIEYSNNQVRSFDRQGQRLQLVGEAFLRKKDLDDPQSDWIIAYSDLEDGALQYINARSGEKRKIDVAPAGRPLHYGFNRRGDLLAVTTVDSSFFSSRSRIANWYRSAPDQPWQQLEEFAPAADFWYPLAAPDTAGKLIIHTRVGRDRWVVARYDIASRRVDEVLAQNADEDIYPGDNYDNGYRRIYSYGMKPRTYWLDERWRQLQEAIDAALPNTVNAIHGNAPDGSLLVFSWSDVDPGRWYLYRGEPRKLAEVAVRKDWLDAAQLHPMELISYAAKDGLKIPAYLTRPAATATPAPLIVYIHGGPQARDYWGFDAEIQVLAHRGYAVFQPQFRGSNGLGKAFEVAGYGQWGLAMQDDISAGVEHLISTGIADPKRICIYGASYGGYAALWGMVKTPQLYRCAVSFAGVSDIGQMLRDNFGKNRGLGTTDILLSRVGDPELNKQQFDQVSPLQHAAEFQGPVLLIHGDEDKRVSIRHSMRMRDALETAKKPVEWLEMPNVGHGIGLLRDQRRYLRKVLAFFDKHLQATVGTAANKAQ